MQNFLFQSRVRKRRRAGGSTSRRRASRIGYGAGAASLRLRSRGDRPQGNATNSPRMAIGINDMNFLRSANCTLYAPFGGSASLVCGRGVNIPRQRRATDAVRSKRRCREDYRDDVPLRARRRSTERATARGMRQARVHECRTHVEQRRWNDQAARSVVAQVPLNRERACWNAWRSL